jgi:hypothetical protein
MKNKDLHSAIENEMRSERGERIKTLAWIGSGVLAVALLITVYVKFIAPTDHVIVSGVLYSHSAKLSNWGSIPVFLVRLEDGSTVTVGVPQGTEYLKDATVEIKKGTNESGVVTYRFHGYASI